VARSGDAEDGDSVSVDEERFSGVESSSERRGNFVIEAADWEEVRERGS
jgi:hypothetical protein